DADDFLSSKEDRIVIERARVHRPPSQRIERVVLEHCHPAARPQQGVELRSNRISIIWWDVVHHPGDDDQIVRSLLEAAFVMRVYCAFASALRLRNALDGRIVSSDVAKRFGQEASQAADAATIVQHTRALRKPESLEATDFVASEVLDAFPTGGNAFLVEVRVLP